MKLKIAWSFILIFLGALAVPAYADEALLMDTIKKMQEQINAMQKTIVQQDAKLGQLERREPRIQMAAPPSGNDTPAAAPMSDYEFNQRLDSATGGAQKWLKNMKFGGDLRLRYEAFGNHGTYPDADRNRFRFRLRYGFDKTFNDQMKAGFSMASGEKVTGNGHNGDPTSTNQTLGNLADFKNIWIEKAYATYTPNWAKMGPVRNLELTGGKFTNPFERGSSDLIFDRDLKPEGAYETVNLKLVDTQDLKLNSYFTAGQYILQESGSLHKDAEMYGYQLGINPVFYAPFLERPVDVLGAVSYYDYSNYNRQGNWKIDQANQSLANGNSVCNTNDLCTGFRVLDYYGELNLAPYGIPVSPFVDVAHNLVAGGSTLDRNAYALGAKIGKQVKKGDWQLMYQYKWLGADAVPGAFTDSDFGYRGYNGNQGNVIKLGYKLTDDLTLNAAAFIVRNLNIASQIDNTSRALIKSEQQSRFQFDLTWKF